MQTMFFTDEMKRPCSLERLPYRNDVSLMQV